MVSIWMLCASRTPGSERHKALQAGPRPRAPRGPPARPQRQMLSAARPGPACPRACGWGPCAGEGRTQQPGRVARSPSLAKEGSYRAKSPGPGTFCTTNPPSSSAPALSPLLRFTPTQPLKGQEPLNRLRALSLYRGLVSLGLQALRPGLRFVLPQSSTHVLSRKVGWVPKGSRQREDGRCKSQRTKGTSGPE